MDNKLHTKYIYFHKTSGNKEVQMQTNSIIDNKLHIEYIYLNVLNYPRAKANGWPQ
jgi:nitrous oxidase accessory protein NosD